MSAINKWSGNNPPGTKVMTEWYSSEMDWKWNVGNIWEKLTRPFRRVFWWIVKSIQYSIFLWGDFDWDYTYILLLIQYKLNRTRRQIVKNSLMLRSHEIATQIKHVEDLIQKWMNDNFCEKEYLEHERYWGKTVDLSKPHKDGGYIWEISREKATTPELKEQERKEQRAIYDRHEQDRQKCLDNIFLYLRKYIEYWWD